VPQAETDVFATAEYERNVTLWSLRDREKINELSTVLDYGARRIAVVQESEHCRLIAASFEGPVNAYDPEGNVVWSRGDLTGVQQVMPLVSNSRALIGLGLEGQPYKILSAIDGREISRLNGISKLYGSQSTLSFLGVTAKNVVCLESLDSRPLWEQPLKSFAILHCGLSPRHAVYSEAAGCLYCFDLDGRQRWVIRPDRNRHFLRVSWNQATEKWMAIDWNFENGGSKRLFEIGEIGNTRVVANLGEMAETEFFASGDLLIGSHGAVIDTQSGQPVWNFI